MEIQEIINIANQFTGIIENNLEPCGSLKSIGQLLGQSNYVNVSASTDYCASILKSCAERITSQKSEVEPPISKSVGETAALLDPTVLMNDVLLDQRKMFFQ